MSLSVLWDVNLLGGRRFGFSGYWLVGIYFGSFNI